MTPEHGLQAAYVRGARGRRMRPVLIAGNVVEARLAARTETQLPQATVELVHSRGPLLSEPLPAAAIEWATVLTATALPEGQPYLRLYQALEGLLEAIEAAPSANGWGAALVRYELLLLAELGFGLDLERCVVTGSNDDLVAVTGGIAVRVAVSFLAEQSDPSSKRWFWSYHVRIENGSEVAVQLLSRSWTIVDGRGAVHEVGGEGVVGEMPLIAPGASFDYVSGCPLDTPDGAMSGSYRMVDEDGSAFDVEIPRFQLLSA